MGERKRRTNYFKQGGVKAAALFPLLLLCLIKYGFVAYKAGMSSMSYYILALMMFLILYALNGLFIPDVLKRMIYFQINKESYKNASHIYHVVFIFSEAIAVIEAVVLFLASDFISKLLFGTILCSLSFKIMAVALILYVARQSIKGYMEGMGNPMPGTVASFIGIILGLITTMILQNSCGKYGSHISALLNQEAYYYAYAAIAAVIGFFVSGLFSLLFMLFILALFRSSIKKQIKQDDIRSVDSIHDILINYVMTYLPEMLNKLYLIGLMFTLLIFYRKQPQITVNGLGMIYTIFLWGMFAICIAYLIGTPFSKKLNSIYRKQDFPHARERMAIHFKVLTYTVFPFLAFTLCAAGQIGEVVFDCSDDVFVHFMRIGVWVILVLTFAVLMNLITIAVINRLACNLIQIFTWILGIMSFQLLKRTMTAEDAFLFSIMISGLSVVLFDMVLVFKVTRFHHDLLRIIGLPVACSILLGINTFIINRFLGNVIGVWFGLLLSAVLGYFIYQLCIVLTHTFDRYEWNEIPFNTIPVLIAKKLNMY